MFWGNDHGCEIESNFDKKYGSFGDGLSIFLFQFVFSVNW
jgi:hypothetical protein